MDIKDLRQEINDIDRELTALFNKRMNVSLEVAKYKTENNMPVLDKARERDVLEKVAAASSPEIEAYTRMLYSDIFNFSRSYQHRIINGDCPLTAKMKEVVESNPRLFPENARVACQGVEGAYAQHACDRIFRYPVISYYEGWDGVFDAVEIVNVVDFELHGRVHRREHDFAHIWVVEGIDELDVIGIFF